MSIQEGRSTFLDCNVASACRGFGILVDTAWMTGRINIGKITQSITLLKYVLAVG